MRLYWKDYTPSLSCIGFVKGLERKWFRIYSGLGSKIHTGFFLAWKISGPKRLKMKKGIKIYPYRFYRGKLSGEIVGGNFV